MNKEFIIVNTAVFLMIFGTYVSGTLLVPYTTSLGGTGLTIGIVFSCMYAVRFVFGAPIGRLSQKKGAKKILTWSMALYPFIAVAYWISWNMPSLIFARLLHGIASAMLMPMAMAYIGEISPVGQEGHYMAVYNAMQFAASAFGPLVAGYIYEMHGIKASFLVLFGLAVLAFALISLMSGGWKGKAQESQATQPGDLKQPHDLRQMPGQRKLLALGSLTVAMAVLLALFGASFTQLALSAKIGMEQIGILVAAINIVIGVSQIPFGRLVDKFDRKNLAVASGMAAALLAACLPFAGGIWSLLLFAGLSGLFISLNVSAFAALSTIYGREAGMSDTMGLLGTANSAGTIAGYLSLGFVTDLFGVGAAFYFAAAVFMLCTGAFVLFWRVPVNRTAEKTLKLSG